MEQRTLTDILGDFLQSGDTGAQNTLAREFNEVCLNAPLDEKYNALIEFIALLAPDAGGSENLEETCEAVDAMISHHGHSDILEDKFKTALSYVKYGVVNNQEAHNTWMDAARLLSAMDDSPRLKN